MHAGGIVRADGSYRATKPGQVFAWFDTRMRMVEEGGERFLASPWIGNMDLAFACYSPAIGTRISEIRMQLPGGDLFNPANAERLSGYEMPNADRRESGFYYRMVRRLDTTGQLSLEV